MIRFLFGLVVFVALVFIGLNFIGNRILATAMHSALGVDVDIKKLQFNPLESKAGVYGLTIYNPQGFDEKFLASIPELFIQYDPSALLKGQVHIREIRFNLDQITVERNAAGKVNLMELDSVKAMGQKKETPQGGESPSEGGGAQKPEGAKVSVLIDEVRLSLGRARYVDHSGENEVIKEFPLEVRDSVIRDVTDPNEVVRQVVLKTMTRVGLNALMPDLGQFDAAFRAQASAKMEEVKQSLGSFLEKARASLETN